MVMGFWGLHSREWFPATAPRHGSKEASVARRVRTRSTTLEVHITFEPSRVGPACVAQAYEQVVPVTRRPLVHICPVIQAEHPRQKPHGGRKDIA